MSVTASVAPSATLSYQWYSNSTGDAQVSVSTAVGANTANYSTGALTAGTHYFFVVVSAPDAASVTSSVSRIDVGTVTDVTAGDATALQNALTAANNTTITRIRLSGNITQTGTFTLNTSGARVILEPQTGNRSLTKSGQGRLFNITNGTLVIRGNGSNQLNLIGNSGNNASLIHLDGGTLFMEAGAAITGNTVTSPTTPVEDSAGVCISSGTFTMNGGEISNNIYQNGSGGGVTVRSGTASFVMNGGTISGNRSNGSTGSNGEGGGIAMYNGGASGIIINGGVIENNLSTQEGGGIWYNSGTVTINGGIITGNRAYTNGGGIFSDTGATFIKNGGTITGYLSGNNTANNIAQDAAGTIHLNQGHAVFRRVNPQSQRRETTAGPGINMNSATLGAAGGWE